MINYNNDPGKKGTNAPGGPDDNRGTGSEGNDDFEEKYDANVDDFDEDDDFESGLDDPDNIEDGAGGLPA